MFVGYIRGDKHKHSLPGNYNDRVLYYLQQLINGWSMKTVCSADQESSKIYIYDGRGDGEPLHVLLTMHSHPVLVMEVGMARAVLITRT